MTNTVNITFPSANQPVEATADIEKTMAPRERIRFLRERLLGYLASFRKAKLTSSGLVSTGFAGDLEYADSDRSGAQRTLKSIASLYSKRILLDMPFIKHRSMDAVFSPTAVISQFLVSHAGHMAITLKQPAIVLKGHDYMLHGTSVSNGIQTYSRIVKVRSIPASIMQNITSRYSEYFTKPEGKLIRYVRYINYLGRKNVIPLELVLVPNVVTFTSDEEGVKVNKALLRARETSSGRFTKSEADLLDNAEITRDWSIHIFPGSIQSRQSLEAFKQNTRRDDDGRSLADYTEEQWRERYLGTNTNWQRASLYRNAPQVNARINNLRPYLWENLFYHLNDYSAVLKTLTRFLRYEHTGFDIKDTDSA